MNFMKMLCIAALCLLVALLIVRLIPFAEIALKPPSDQGRERVIEDIRHFFTLLSVILLSVVVGLAYILPTPAETSARRVLRGWLAGFALALLLVIGTIVYINPRKYYGTGFYQSQLLLTRWLKADLYADLPAAPDIVIMGSSRAFRIGPDYIENSLGYTAFNAAVEGGNILDASILEKYIEAQHGHEMPKVLLIEAVPPLGYNSSQTAQSSPLNFLPYMDLDTAALAIQERLEGLLDLNQLAEAVFTLRYYQNYGTPASGVTLYPDGFVLRHANPAGFEARLNSHLREGRVLSCKQIDEQGQHVVAELISTADEHDMSIIFYTTPLHPRYYDRFMGTKPRYVHCHKLFTDYMQDLMAAHDNVFYLDYSRLESIGGVATSEGYYDAHHTTELNSNLLIDAAADTIHRAYDIAVQKRAKS